jgi:uncharacterized protein
MRAAAAGTVGPTWRRALSRRLEPWCRVATVLLLNIPLIALPLSLNLRGVTPDPLVLIYVAGIILGYYVFLLLAVVSIPSIALVFAPRVSLRLAPRAALLLSGLILALFNYYLFLDNRVYAACRFHIDAFWMDYAWHNLAGIGLPASTLVCAGLVLIGLLALELGFVRLAGRRPPRRWILPVLASLSLIALIASQAIHVVAFERDIGRITTLTPYFPFYMPATSHRDAVKYGDLLPIDATPRGGTGGDPPASLQYPLRDCPASLPAGRRPLNVVFLVLESWRYDAMSDSITPNISSLARKSSVFRRHFSSGNATTPGIFGLLYGLHPTYWMSVKSNNALLHNPLLIDLMEDAHYAFGIYADSHFERHKIKDAMFRDIAVNETFAGSSRPAKEVDMTNQMISFLRAQRADDHPFMLFAFYKASHYHYSYPDSFRVFTPVKEINAATAMRRQERASYLNDYHNAVRFDDALIGDLLAELARLGMMENTVVVITTDHGEEFDDDGTGGWGHASNFTQYQIRVPLVLYYPGRAPRVVDAPTGHVDIPTTLIQEIFGVGNDPADYSNGRNLFGDLTGDRALVVASNVNHAFVIGEDAYAVFPLYTQGYRLADIKMRAQKPQPDLVRTAMEEIGRFYLKTSTPAAPARFSRPISSVTSDARCAR